MKHGWLGGLLAALFIAGCGNSVNAPEPMTDDQARQMVDQMSPQDQIDWVNRSPMSAEDKAKRIREIKEKAGMPLDDAPASGSAGTGAAPAGN